MSIAAAPARLAASVRHALAARPSLQAASYVVVSGLALGIDTGALLVLAHYGLAPALAGGAGYMLGLVAHYGLSSALVFNAAATAKGNWRLLAEFCLTGLAGLLLTMAIVALLAGFAGCPLFAAKLVAVAVSFVAVFLMRKLVVFAIPNNFAPVSAAG